MEHKRYSISTINNYLHSLTNFLRFMKPKAISEINEEDLVSFINNYVIPNGYSFSYQNLAINAIKLFYKQVCKTSFQIESLKRPQRQMQLPTVISTKEVKKILSAHQNIKHRLMLSLIYACGLRRSELLNLKPEDLNGERQVLHIRQSKANKDRYIRFSQKLLEE